MFGYVGRQEQFVRDCDVVRTTMRILYLMKNKVIFFYLEYLFSEVVYLETDINVVHVFCVKWGLH